MEPDAKRSRLSDFTAVADEIPRINADFRLTTSAELEDLIRPFTIWIRPGAGTLGNKREEAELAKQEDGKFEDDKATEKAEAERDGNTTTATGDLVLDVDGAAGQVDEQEPIVRPETAPDSQNDGTSEIQLIPEPSPYISTAMDLSLDQEFTYPLPFDDSNLSLEETVAYHAAHPFPPPPTRNLDVDPFDSTPPAESPAAHEYSDHLLETRSVANGETAAYDPTASAYQFEIKDLIEGLGSIQEDVDVRDSRLVQPYEIEELDKELDEEERKDDK